MIKKPILDSMDKHLLHMRRLYNLLSKYKTHSLLEKNFMALKREARGLDTLMREAIKRGDVRFPRGKKV